jgi:general secretion pathway protein K
MKNLDQKGFALLFVIWVSALIAAVATGLVIKVRTNTLVAANIGQSEKAKRIADGVTRLLALRLSEQKAFASNGVAFSCDYDGTRVVYLVQDQAGLVDINTAPDYLLIELISRLGGSPASAKLVTDAIFDYRDPDQTAREGGAEPATYAGRNFGPKNAPFESVEELDQIPGLEDAQYRKLIELVTVNSFEAGIDPAVAPPELRRIFDQGAQGDFTGALASFVSRSQKRSFELDVRATLKEGGRYRRKALVFVTGQPDRPFAFMSWQRGGAWEDESSPTTQSCLTQ